MKKEMPLLLHDNQAIVGRIFLFGYKKRWFAFVQHLQEVFNNNDYIQR